MNWAKILNMIVVNLFYAGFAYVVLKTFDNRDLALACLFGNLVAQIGAGPTEKEKP